MKHIGWCLEKIQIELSRLPKRIDTKEDKKKANKIIDNVEKYAKTCSELIKNPKLKFYVKRLEDSYLRDAKEKGKEVERIIKDLNDAINIIFNYIILLRKLISRHSSSYPYRGKQIIVASYHLISKDKQKLGKEYTILQNFRSLMRSRMHQFSNKADQITHMIDQKFGDGRGDLRKEFSDAIHTKEELKEIVTNEEHLEEFLK